jgi:hypothetical protein
MSTVNATSYKDASGGSNAVLYGVAAPANSMGFRNRILNGNMVIDQRNAGASVSITDGLLRYAVDRTAGYGTASAGVFSVQRSATAPQGFTNSLLCTVTTASTPSSSHEYGIRQNIEGFNTADLGWGSASAQAITLSFWVRSSVTGTFAGSVANSAYNRAYVFTYSISAANTWEQKSITVPGDTSGTWLTDNGAGIRLNFNLGAGSSLTGTAGVWGATYLQSATGSVNLIATSGATFYITGVQLEAGSVASPFERRDYGRELMMCQRYYQLNTASNGYATGTTGGTMAINGAVVQRSAPTLAVVSGTGALIDYGTALRNLTSFGSASSSTSNGTVLDFNCSATTGSKAIGLFANSVSLSAEL